jgi:F-type H+-transporting ATPase subunit O
VDASLKKEGVSKLLAQGKYSDLTKNLFQVLVENGRLDQTEKIILAFQQLMTASRGEVTIQVTSAKVFSFFITTKRPHKYPKRI